MTPRPLAAITGASSGIGAVFARKLAPTHDLLLIARRKPLLDRLAADLGTHGIETLPADLANPSGQTAVAERLAADPRLALLVNNAGFGTKGAFWEATLESQESMHQLHVMATVRLTHAALQGMVARNAGSIVNVASVASFLRSPGSASYCATKSWMAVFTEALHLDLKARGKNIQVQALCPGFTYSEFHDTLGVERSKLAGPGLWLSADHVVDDSLAALKSGKLFVIPGWKYRLLVAIGSKLPSALRVKLESSPGRQARLK
jgi:short-subunit dehydrogenase